VRLEEARRTRDAFVDDLTAHSRRELPSLRAIYEDLRALAGEFPEIQLDLRERQLSAITDPISLEDVELGRFEIRLCWSRLLSGQTYEVHALEANRAAVNDSVTHPHVQGDSLCEGEGKVAIRGALQEGRLLDFFLLVRQTLQTYNPRSAYVPLSDWVGVTCSDCGTSAGEDECCTCGRCGCDLCDDCSRSCGSCGGFSCSGCDSFCRGCDVEYCSGCISSCNGCGESYCPDCLTSRQCSDCRANEEDEVEENEVEVETTYEASASPAVHAVRLGEAYLPA